MGLAMYSELLVFSENLKNGPGHLFGGAIEDAKTVESFQSLRKRPGHLFGGATNYAKATGIVAKLGKWTWPLIRGYRKTLKPFGAA